VDTYIALAIAETDGLAQYASQEEAALYQHVSSNIPAMRQATCLSARRKDLFQAPFSDIDAPTATSAAIRAPT
jgi:hypothetical protein